MISGIFIVFENQYNVGDIIVLDDFRGTVFRIGVRTTTIVDAGGNYKIVNNSEIRNVQNRSQVLSVALCDVGISYDEDVRQVEKIAEAAFPTMYENNKSVFEAPPTYLGVEEIGGSSIVLRYCVKCKEVNYFVAKRRLNREIRLLFADKGIEIPFQQVDIHNR